MLRAVLTRILHRHVEAYNASRTASRQCPARDSGSVWIAAHGDRNRARPAVGEGLPFLLFRLQDDSQSHHGLRFPKPPYNPGRPDLPGAEQVRMLPSSPLTGRVEDWRAGLGRSLGSPLSRPFVCECPTISSVPRFQSPPRRTQHADFPHCAPPFASRQRLWDLSCWGNFRPVASHSVGVEQP
jgi:hypothetical protein